MDKASIPLAILVSALLPVLLLACAPKSPAPDIEATVAARVQSTLAAAAPTATPQPTAAPKPTATPRPTPTPPPTLRPPPTAFKAPAKAVAVALTVVEYADWCNSMIALNPDLHDDVTNREVVSALDNQIDEYRKVMPPGELENFHDANQSALVTMRDALSAEPPGGSFAIGTMAYAALLAYPAILRAESELAATTYFRLAEARCIYDAAIAGGSEPDSLWSVPGDSVNNPVAVGGTLKGTDGTELVVTGITQDAWPIIEAGGSSYADPPKAGHRYYMISVAIAYRSGDDSIYITDSDFRLLDDELVLMHPRCGYEYALPDRLSGEVFAGGRITGNVCFEVRDEATDFILVHQPDWDNSSRRFLRLEQPPGLGKRLP